MSQRVLRGGLIGCGFFAENHLNAWCKEVAGAELVALCDLEQEKAERAGQRFGIAKTYCDAATMLSTEALDFVDIVTTMDSHRSLVELAVKHHVAAIVQKPFAPNLVDAKAMIAACDQAGVMLMVHENFRWRRPLMAVREVLESSDIGRPFFARISFRHGNPIGYENQPYLFKQTQFIINDVGIHLLDLARYYFGEVERIYTELQNVNSCFAGEDVATMLLRHKNGVTCVVDLSVSTTLNPDPFPQTLVTIEGDQGTVELMADYTLKISRKDEVNRQEHDVSPKQYNWGRKNGAVQESVVNIQQHWTDCLHKVVQPDTSGSDNLKSLALVFAAYQSAEQKQPVTLASL